MGMEFSLEMEEHSSKKRGQHFPQFFVVFGIEALKKAFKLILSTSIFDPRS